MSHADRKPALRALLLLETVALLLTVCALTALSPGRAHAGVIVPSQAGDKPLALRRHSVRVEIKDQVARATVDEVFENPGDHAVEGNYALPLPDGAAVSEFATWVDGRRVAARIEENQQAAKTYAAAKATGAAPALLEKSDGRTFQVKVDGIAAHGTKRVEAAWAQILPYDGGVVTLRLPLAPRGGAGAGRIGELSVAITLRDQKQIKEVKVLSGHAARVEKQQDGYAISYAATEFGGDDSLGELVISYRTESSRLGLSFVPFKPQGADNEDGYFLLLASPQELTTAEDIVHKDVVFVFDRSGSMGERSGATSKIEQAREALKRCLGNLNAEDRFGIVAFDDSLDPFRNKLLPASSDNVREGIAFADKLAPGGSTNIDGALMAGLSMLDDPARPRVLIFMTDGLANVGVSNPQEIAQRVRAKNKGVARIFSFGVGNDVNRTFLEALGRENRGSHDFVEAGQSIETVVAGFYAKIARPVLSDLSISFGEVTTVMQYPDVLPDLYKGSQLVMVGRYRGAGKAHGELTGMLNGQKHVIPFAADFSAAGEENAFVARLWASRRIDFLLSQGRLQGESSEARAEVVALSLRYQIVTPYTSMVAVQPQAQRVAMVSPMRVRPGDPVITVRAARTARSVRVTLPFAEREPHAGTVRAGEVRPGDARPGEARTQEKEARWDEEAQAWTARFLVPAGTADGSYPIAVRIVDAAGHEERLALSISVDTHAPSLVASAAPVRAGELLTLHAQAAVAPIDLLAVLLSRGDRGEALRALFDVRRVTARLWDGREVELALGDGFGFSAQVETGRTLARGSYPVVLSARDFAGNTARTVAMVEVR